MKVGQTGINLTGPFQPQPIAYSDLHTQPVPCWFYPISFGLRPGPNQALWPARSPSRRLRTFFRLQPYLEEHAFVELMLIWHLVLTSSPPPFFSLIPVHVNWPVYSKFPLTWANYSVSVYNQQTLTTAVNFRGFSHSFIFCCWPDKQKANLKTTCRLCRAWRCGLEIIWWYFQALSSYWYIVKYFQISSKALHKSEDWVTKSYFLPYYFLSILQHCCEDNY